MNRQRLYSTLRPGANDSASRVALGAHAMVFAGIGCMLAMTEPDLLREYGDALAAAFSVIATFFTAEYALRLYAAPAAPGGEHRGELRSRLSWAVSLGGIVDLLACCRGHGARRPQRGAYVRLCLVFKLVRYSPGLTILQRVIAHARPPAVVLLGFSIVLLAAAASPICWSATPNRELWLDPAALWWAW